MDTRLEAHGFPLRSLMESRDMKAERHA